MQYAQEQTGPESGKTAGTSPIAIGHKDRILLAEDNYEMCRLIASTLRKAGYEVTMCANGINLIEHLGTFPPNGKEESYALVITDIRMPGITGMEILAGLRRAEGVPPIILITAFGDAETHRRAAELGAVAVLDKPFEMGTLLRVVRKTLAH
jgi:DNA-binding response OmpR family regulator